MSRTGAQIQRRLTTYSSCMVDEHANVLSSTANVHANANHVIAHKRLADGVVTLNYTLVCRFLESMYTHDAILRSTFLKNERSLPLSLLQDFAIQELRTFCSSVPRFDATLNFVVCKTVLSQKAAFYNAPKIQHSQDFRLLTCHLTSSLTQGTGTRISKNNPPYCQVRPFPLGIPIKHFKIDNPSINISKWRICFTQPYVRIVHTVLDGHRAAIKRSTTSFLSKLATVGPIVFFKNGLQFCSQLSTFKCQIS
jgi:hypothetical protein